MSPSQGKAPGCLGRRSDSAGRVCVCVSVHLCTGMCVCERSVCVLAWLCFGVCVVPCADRVVRLYPKASLLTLLPEEIISHTCGQAQLMS